MPAAADPAPEVRARVDDVVAGTITAMAGGSVDAPPAARRAAHVIAAIRTHRGEDA